MDGAKTQLQTGSSLWPAVVLVFCTLRRPVSPTPFFTRPPGGQMWPGSWCWDVHRRIVEAEWSRAREWCMGTGQCGEEAQRGRAAFKLPRLLPDKLLITAAARIRE